LLIQSQANTERGASSAEWLFALSGVPLGLGVATAETSVRRQKEYVRSDSSVPEFFM
jgi:hypothetical protein